MRTPSGSNRGVAVFVIATAAATLSGCATRQPPRPVAQAPSAPPMAVLPPAGAAANLVIPTRRADGSYPTPNQQLSAAAAVWHLRVALNVAALSCRGTSESLLVSGYNQLIRLRSATLATAERTLIAEYRGDGPVSDRSAYDAAMTRLYNYFAQPPVQASFCAAAAPLVAEATVVPAAAFDAFAVRAIGQLDQPFIDFYRAYDAYRDARFAQRTAAYPGRGAVIAIAAPASAGRVPRLGVDPAVFRIP